MLFVLLVAAPLSLGDARALADHRSGGLLTAQAGVDVARAGVEVAGQLTNPTLSASYGRDDPRLQVGLDVRVPILGQRGAALASAEAQVAVAEADTLVERAKLHAAVRRAFSASWAAEEQAQIAIDGARIAAELADLAAQKFRTGSAAQIEVEQSSLSSRRAAQDKLDRDAEALASRRELEALLATAVERLEPPPAVNVPPEGELLEYAQNHPEIQALRRQEQAALTKADEERAAIRPLPTLSVIAQRYEDPAIGFGIRGGIAFDLPLLSLNRGRVHEQEQTAHRAQLQAQAARQRLTGQLRAARARWAAASARADFYGGAFLQSAARVLDMARAGYRIGRTSLVAVLQAQNDLSSARSRALDARLEMQKAVADLEEAIGADL
jgi:cobalt-zinc-cadmium efflux system outer membrane protein